MVERERLSSAYTDMLGRLAAHYMETERHQEAVRAGYRLLEKDRCYARLGRRDRALRQYRVCEKVLEKEHDVAPSPETRDLYGSPLGTRPARSGDAPNL